MKYLPIIFFFLIITFVIIKTFNKFNSKNRIIYSKLLETKNKLFLENVNCTFKKLMFFTSKIHNVYFVDSAIIIIYKYGITKKTYIITNEENVTFPTYLFQNKITDYILDANDGNIVVNGKMSTQNIFTNNFEDETNLTLIINFDTKENNVKNELEKLGVL